MIAFCEPPEQLQEDESQSDSEWEIVSVEKVQSLKDLEWNEPISKESKEEKAAENAVHSEWKCPKCASVNDFAYKFCPKCGCNKDRWKPPQDNKKVDSKMNGIVLKKTSVIND